jgi:hydrogenase nickel incorporation protein HypA/HybF
MHELSIAQSILEIALTNARAEGATRILNIRVVVGALTTYVNESLQLCWDFVTEGTLAAGSSIELIRTPGLVQCLNCFTRFSTMDTDFRCPQCGGLWRHALAGEECYVDAIDIDEEATLCR